MSRTVVFEANDAIEAQLISDLLEQHHIESEIEGNYLQGGIGEIQTMGLIRIRVDDSDYSQARILIEKWLNTDVDAVHYQTDHSHWPAIFLTGLITGIILTLLIGF